MDTKTRSAIEDGGDRIADLHGDARRAVVYLVVKEAPDYVAIMDVLEASITDLTPGEFAVRLQAAGLRLDPSVIQARLDKLDEWGVVSGRSDTSQIFRFTDLLARNWKYVATPTGRHVQRFYRKFLAGALTVREIPLLSLSAVVAATESLAAGGVTEAPAAELIGRLFVSHDDLDAALVGAEDSLAGLVDRFDLTDESTAELKSLLVGYATHVAVELEKGAARVHRALRTLLPRFGELAGQAVAASEARPLIERGALGASRGGRSEDWDALLAWFDPNTGRSARFGLRLVRALPSMHVNLRRLHSSSGAATSRSRALALAKACLDPQHGPAIMLAALGDHPWRKLHGVSDDVDADRTRSWREPPHVAVPELLRATGRAGARGRAPASRDDSAAREEVLARRKQRAAEHDAAIREVLAADPGATLSDRAARVAYRALLAAAGASERNGRRTGNRDGLACTLFSSKGSTSVVTAPTWRVLTPGRLATFHLPGATVLPPRIVIAPDHTPDVAPVVLVGAG